MYIILYYLIIIPHFQRIYGAIALSSEELDELEKVLEHPIPIDYRELLSICRSIEIAPGMCIYGIYKEYVSQCETPYFIDDFALPGRYLAIGDYWRFADGDQLLVSFDDPDQPVVAYFHEHGPRIEYYAPSVSFALWRLTYEDI